MASSNCLELIQSGFAFRFGFALVCCAVLCFGIVSVEHSPTKSNKFVCRADYSTFVSSHLCHFISSKQSKPKSVFFDFFVCLSGWWLVGRFRLVGGALFQLCWVGLFFRSSLARVHHRHRHRHTPRTPTRSLWCSFVIRLHFWLYHISHLYTTRIMHSGGIGSSWRVFVPMVASDISTQMLAFYYYATYRFGPLWQQNCCNWIAVVA